jgi:hypothetical protein
VAMKELCVCGGGEGGGVRSCGSGWHTYVLSMFCLIPGGDSYLYGQLCKKGDNESKSLTKMKMSEYQHKPN